ncbi:MAG: EI24 domain-containing protein [Pseudomonadota bacterium]
MIFGDVLRALGQIGDPRFMRVLAIGIGLTIALLAGIYALLVTLIGWFVPDTMSLPLIGEISWVDNLLSWGSLVLMLGLSVILMVPVASAFTSLFLDEVADAVEGRHYPHLPQAPRATFAEGVSDSISFLGVLIGANLVALVAYILFAPFAPLIFIALNGFLLGREYFQLVAMRRLGREGARAARRRHAGQIWLAGSVMALPLMIPLVNLAVPILGAATFTHLFHRLERA